jgi:hypothetical protein
MRIILVLLFLFCSFDAFASTTPFTFIDSITEFFFAIWNFLTITLPAFVMNLFAYILKYILLSKLETLIFFTEFSYTIALSFLESVNLTEVLNTAFSSLDSDLAQTLIDIRFFDGAQLIIEAFVARYILNMMGW